MVTKVTQIFKIPQFFLSFSKAAYVFKELLMGEDGASLFLCLHIIVIPSQLFSAIGEMMYNFIALFILSPNNSVSLFVYKVTRQVFREGSSVECLLMPKKGNETSRCDTLSSLGGLCNCPFSFQNNQKFDSITESPLNNTRYQVYLQEVCRLIETTI